MTVRHIRDTLRALRKALPDCEIVHLRQKVHHVYEIKRSGVSRRLIVSVSPRDIEASVAFAVQEAKRLMNKTCQT